MKTIPVCFNKLLLFVLLFQRRVTSPQGPEGPEGPAGAPGTGGGGTATNIISVITPATASFTWEQISRSATNIVYRLKWRSGATEGTTYRLPDSLTTRIDNGALLIYAWSNLSDGEGKRFQLAYAPAEFYSLATYIYQLEKIAGRYVITVLADMQDYGSTNPRLPMLLHSAEVSDHSPNRHRHNRMGIDH